MTHPIKNGTASVLLVEPQASRRILLQKIIRNLKFPNVMAVGTVKEAISILENNSAPVDWVLTGLFASSQYNGMHLLGTCLAKERLRSVRVSIFIEPNEKYCLADAFALGLFSCHHRHTSADGMTNELQTLTTIGTQHEWNDQDIAAHYLRTFLQQSKMHDSLLRLERQILTTGQSKMSSILNYAEALVLANGASAAEPVLAKINPTSPADQKRLQGLLALLGEQDQTGGVPTLSRHVKQVIAVDPDESTLNSIEEALRLTGVETVHKFTKAVEALAFIKKNPEPDLIIQEWRLADYPGPGFFQSVRQLGFINTSIVIYSSLVKNSDRPLLKEIGIADVIEKPKSPRMLAGQISSLVRTEHACRDVNELEKKIRLALSIKDLKAAREFYQIFLKKNPPDRAKSSLAAEFAYFDDDLREATDIAVQILHSHGEDVCVLNLLGKIYMRQGQLAQAIYYFDRANDLAPSNIERLCNLAVAQASLGEADEAEESLLSARNIGGDTHVIDEAEVKLGLINGQVERARSFMENFRHSAELIGFINNRGVWLATQGRVQDGIGLYETALKSLTPNLFEIVSSINYNLALAHVRAGNVEQAAKVIDNTPEAASPALASKINSLQAKVEKAVRTGSEVTLNEARAVKKQRIERFSQLTWLTDDIAPGCARLYGIFVPNDPVNPDVVKMLEVMSFQSDDAPRRKKPPQAS